MRQTAIKSRIPGVRQPKARQAARQTHGDYLALIDIFPLRPLRNERDYHAAAAVLDSLAVRAEGSLSPGEQDYLDTLTMLVEAYDQRDDEAGIQLNDPIATLKYLMEESGMTQANLGRLLGNRALASLILNGHRQLSKSHIRKLAGHFQVSAALFLQD